MTTTLVYDFKIKQYASFGSDFNFKYLDSVGDPIDISGYTARLQVRPDKESGTILVDMNEGAGLTLGSDGTINLSLTAAQTGNLAPIKGAVYDLLIVDGSGLVTRFAEGLVDISAGVTHD